MTNMTAWVYRSDFYAPGARGLTARHIRKMLAHDARKRRQRAFSTR